MRRQIILGIIGPLTIGGILYLLFRPVTITFFILTEQLGLNEIIEQLRSSTQTMATKMPHWTIYNLPDGLWSFAFTTAMLQHWRNKIDSQSIFWIALTPLMGISIEFFQKLNFLAGTFDFADVFSILIGFAFSVLIFKRNPKFSAE